MNLHFRHVLLIVIFLFSTQLFSQEDEITNNSFYYPNSHRYNRIIQTFGLSTAELPEDLIEAEGILRSPLFYYRIKYRLPEGFKLEAAAESNLITYHVSLGPGYIYNYDKFGFSAGSEISWWTGRLKVEGFNSEIYGWHLYPNISAGYNFPYFTLTLKVEFMVILDQMSKIGSIKEDLKYDTFSAYAFGLYLEQPLWKDHYIVLGIKSNFTKFYSPLWSLFPTFDRYIYISEIVVGYNL